MDDGERRGKELVDDELERVRKRLLKVNEKIKQYSNLQKNSRPFDGKEYTPSNDLLGKEIPIEEMHAKLHAINEYVRNRALGKDVDPPVFERHSPPVIKRPAPPLKKLSREIVIEPVPEIGESLEESSEIVADETTTIEIPELMTRGRKETAARLGVGLDLGTAYIVAGREVEEKKVFVKNERNAFLSVRCDQSTKELLTRLKVKYVSLQDKLYVLGSMALELADIFGRETQRSMNMGILNPSEAESIPIIKLLVQNILWPPREEGEVCCFSIPAQPIDRDQDTIYHRGVFEGILRSIGFEPMIIDEGYAVVLSELEAQDFTGIGVSCGAGMVNICAAFKSIPVLSFSITRGGDWIDKSAATVLGVPSSRVTTIKEHGMNLKNPKNREEEAIVIYYRNYIHYLLENMSRVFGKSSGTSQFKDPVDIIFAGGSSLVPGFLDVVKEEIKTAKFGFTLGKILHAKEPFTSVVRGCLFNAIEVGKKR
ncbi:MAG TPA: hypothetical protein DD723_01430 [Candidatus Omnitrophica bacterium]|nr:hypothetical protein [Candidatus Omnitrophota bacterium]